MSLEDFYCNLPAIWLVFAGSELNHGNDWQTFIQRETSSDQSEASSDQNEEFSNQCEESLNQREKRLVDLLISFLNSRLAISTTREVYDPHTISQLTSVRNLLEVWSHDLDLIYEIRSTRQPEIHLREVARRFFKRIRTLEDCTCTVIPNGLISADHTQKRENVNLAIVKKRGTLIDWIQVNPGGTYHQICSSFAGDKSNAYLEITGINPQDITEEWLYLLLSLKAVSPGENFAYKEISSYECLFSHLNGRTEFQTQPDENFVFYSHTSPEHTWQVIDQTFRYLLQHFLGESHLVVYKRLITSFKLVLLENTFNAYQDVANEEAEQYHYLLQEMCRKMAQQAFEHGDHGQKDLALKHIDSIKTSITLRCSQQDQELGRRSELNDPDVMSLSFVAPHLNDPTHSSSDLKTYNLQADPIFIKPSMEDDIIDYLQGFKNNFINELIDKVEFNELKCVVLLSNGIEDFFIDYLAKTDILQKSNLPFSRNDTVLANTLVDLAEIYFSCQGRLVGHFLLNMTYQPQFYAKNVTIQFFVYAAVAALNFRDKNIGPLLAYHKLCTATSKVLTLEMIIPYLVIDDARYLKVLLAIQAFFSFEKYTRTLFSHESYDSNFEVTIYSFSVENNNDVAFSYQLLQQDDAAYTQFEKDYRDLEDVKFHRKWRMLAYGKKYLPALYCLLFNAAYLAKVSLTGFPSSEHYKSSWHFHKHRSYKSSKVCFRINQSKISTQPNFNQLTSYLICSDSSHLRDPYQRFINCEENIDTANAHFFENEIIASQCERPVEMECFRYMHLGFLQSEPWQKLERLYIALKHRQLNFTCKQECIVIKQTLFETSVLIEAEEGFFNLLEWTARTNPSMIHKLGLLCVEKALTMKYQLTQHNVIGEILEVVLGLLTFYPAEFKNELLEGITEIYYLLRDVLKMPPTHLSDNTLLHLNAYLIISVQAKPDLIETETITILKAFWIVQNYKVKGILLDNNLLRRIYVASFKCSDLMAHKLEHHTCLLNDMMLSILPQWDQTSVWQKNQSGLLFTCGDYSINTLLGNIYFRNRPITGLPDTFTKHRVFEDYLGNTCFAVLPIVREMNTIEVPCYVSVDQVPQMRLTLISHNLLIEECIQNNFQLFVPSKELLSNAKYPRLFYELPSNNEVLRHWLENNTILIKDQQRHIIYEWDLDRNTVFSSCHGGYVVPWEQIETSNFKTWLERIELPEWIEIIAQETDTINIQSLHFPRLGLHFDYTQGLFSCRQIHSYKIAIQQHLNTLKGFSNYLILEKYKQSSTHETTKVVIPHRKISTNAYFYTKIPVVDLKTVQYPSYFVYDFDRMTGVLKANDISAQLYLGLLYYCTASFDNNDESRCNSYHLARDNLEVCWKDQPYNKVELNIIQQLLSLTTVGNIHLIALYLKVVSLLSSSLHLAFLYTDRESLQNTERSEQLLKTCVEQAPNFLTLYLQNKATIFARIRLNAEEEQEVKERFQVSLNVKNVSKSYKSNYQQLFDKSELCGTAFLSLFQKHTDHLSFTYDTEGLNFSSGINGIFNDRFRLMHFLTLYKMTKTSDITITKYRYLLHYIVLRANKIIPSELVMMLARALLMVAENPEKFPESPRWFNSIDLFVDLSHRSLTEKEVIKAMPPFVWQSYGYYASVHEKRTAEMMARINNKHENECIWSYLARHDLNAEGIPLRLPDNFYHFSLQFEDNINFSNEEKRSVVRQLYLQAACNDAMYKFFVDVLQRCDILKRDSEMGWTISPFIYRDIVTITEGHELAVVPNLQPETPEKRMISEQPLVDLNNFFKVKKRHIEIGDFLFESQLKEPSNGYQKQFYIELKDSWEAFRNETTFTYTLLNSQSMNELESYLKVIQVDIHEQAEHIWNSVATLLNNRPNSDSDNYFALRWYSGQVSHYHKGDILALLVEPHRLVSYNPACFDKQDSIIQDLISYVKCEINVVKISRALASIEQCRLSENESEQFSLLQCLVRNLQESVDPACYEYPHWFLFQLENNVILRSNQRELIIKMLNQTEKAMYQLNMGEGKTSIILPLLSYNIANGQQLLRINVLSSLLITMKNLLRHCFSGLLRKRIYTLPFYRDTDISEDHLTIILQTLKTCQLHRHLLVVTPEHRLCLQLKVRELMLVNQQQIGATNIFNWQTYRQRVRRNVEVYQNMTEEQIEQLLAGQDKQLEICLLKENYIDQNNQILKVPPRGQGRKEFAQFKESINDPNLLEWSCLKAAYRELLYNCVLGQVDSRKKLTLLNTINSLSSMDLLDESDEILQHGTELNYTLGDKYMFSGEEWRWQIPQLFIEAIFCDPVLREIIIAGKEHGFTEINLYYISRGGVPFIQFLDEPYFEKHIKPKLIDKFFAEHLPTHRKYNTNISDPHVKDETSSLKSYVAGQLLLSTEKKVITFLADKGPLKDKLLIAKGWLSHGILFHVFHARYRVQYGLDLDSRGQLRKRIAIPFWGKDTPSPRSEFGHPDVMLGCTIISYLYHGLNQEQLKNTLLRLKNKFSCYIMDKHLKEWTEASRDWIESQADAFPPSLLTSVENIDLADEQCLSEIHKYLSYNRLAIYFYLNEFVLLEEAMQYRTKISANAHSLVGYNAALGFSGTDDRKITMPFQIKSLRSTTEQGTNGKLLSVLSQERNSDYYPLLIDDTLDLLQQLCHFVGKNPDCHALIDAGAIITGFTNHAVASMLICLLPQTFLGILYFSDEGNDLTVLTREKETIALQNCYLDKQYIFAYLDDVHTRGTDIMLPLNCKAILTIGLGMEKDKFMQAAMRLRQLAEKQSVSLWGTEAVTLAIARDNKIDATSINSAEVIKWVTRNTIDRINLDLFPVVLRKINFQFLQKAESLLKEAPTTMDTLIQYCQEKELFLLEEFYALSPQREDLNDRLYWMVAAKLRTFWQELEQELMNKQLTHTDFYKSISDKEAKKSFRQRLDTICEELSIYLETGFVHNALDNDQEKEVEVEIIEEQQVVVRIERREACVEKKWDVTLILKDDFVILAEQRGIIMPLDTIEKFIHSPDNLKNVIWHPDIYMTSNYINSVECSFKEALDNYLRPVDAVLVHRLRDRSKAILLSGKEAALIKSEYYLILDNFLLVHINDIDGPTQLPVGSTLSVEELELFTTIKIIFRRVPLFV